MNLPDAHLAIVEQEKIVDYLLNAAHPDNGGKAAFFLALGLEDWQTLAAAFRNMAETGAVTKSMASPHVQKYIVDCKMETPSGGTPRVRAVWIIDTGLTAPRLVTGYPHDD
jgi:hypothetical protein